MLAQTIKVCKGVDVRGKTYYGLLGASTWTGFSILPDFRDFLAKIEAKKEECPRGVMLRIKFEVPRGIFRPPGGPSIRYAEFNKEEQNQILKCLDDCSSTE